MYISLIVLFYSSLFFHLFYDAMASVGDNLIFFKRCLNVCLSHNCSNSNQLKLFEEGQPFYLKLFYWNCDEECKYQCQWSSIDYLIKELGPITNLPQFYGKVIFKKIVSNLLFNLIFCFVLLQWTFYRIWGIQEPASALFSFLNLITTYLAWTKYCRQIFKLSSKSNDTNFTAFNTINKHFIHATIHAILSINAWLWSTIFHIRDTSLTEVKNP